MESDHMEFLGAERPALCELLQETTYLVFVLLIGEDERPELIGSGTAVAVNERGDLMTAAHVVTTRLPIRAEDLDDPRVVVLAKRKSGVFSRYASPLCGLMVDLGELLTDRLTVDLAVLRPVDPQARVAFLPICLRAPIVGESVLMAGYPDDIELPFTFDQMLPPSSVQVLRQRANLEVSKRLLMIRSGMVGHSASVKINEAYEGDFFHVDNVLHSGASGGPVVSTAGEVLGILTKRAVTRVAYEETPNLRVPSGAAVAITPRILLPELKKLDVLRGEN
jgi:CBS domain-containing protein